MKAAGFHLTEMELTMTMSELNGGSSMTFQQFVVHVAVQLGSQEDEECFFWEKFTCDEGEEVPCPGSGQLCSGNTCCPGVLESNGFTFPCPSASNTFSSCSSPSKVQNCVQATHCEVTLYDKWAEGYPLNADRSPKTGSAACGGSSNMNSATQECLTGDKQIITITDEDWDYPFEVKGSIGVTSIKVTGDSCCQVNAYSDSGCKDGAIMGVPITPSTQLAADTQSGVYDPGVVTGVGNLQSKLYWTDNAATCIRVSCGEDVSCVAVSSGMFYSSPGASGWAGLDMPGQGRSVEEHWTGCQYRCAAIESCTYFTWWFDGGCHLQDSNAVLRLCPVPEFKTIHGRYSCSGARL